MPVGNRTISQVLSRGDEWDDKYNNTNVPYFITFTEEGDEEFELSQRVSSDPPNIGDTIEVDSYQDRGDHPRKIKKVFNQGGSGGSSGGGKKSGGGGYKKSPEDDRKITRLAAHKVAVEVWNPSDNWEKFTELCDKLCEDAFAYGGAPPVPGVNAPAAAPQASLGDLQTQYKNELANAGIPISDGVAAIGATYQRDKLQVGDDIPTLVAKAKELADEDVPF